VPSADLNPESVARGGRATHTDTDGIVGHFALHHVDCWDVAPKLAARLRPGALAAFAENFDSNPVFRVSRRHVAGRFGVPRYGSRDGQPLRASDLDALRSAFGHVRTEVLTMTFLRLFDRQVLHFRSPKASRAIGAIDDLIGSVDRLSFLSYHRLVVCGPIT
jgi:hypothetical protein